MRVLKKIMTICTIPLIFLGLLAGCSKSQETDIYSCSSAIDILIKKDIKKYQNMSKKNWQELDESFKIPVYRTFSSEKKREFWIDKYKNAKKTAEWSELELNHISDLSFFIEEHPDLFSDDYLRDPKKVEEVLTFSLEWNQYAVNNLKWTDLIISSLISSPENISYNILDSIGFKDHESKTPIDGIGGQNTCMCSQTSDYCDPMGEGLGVFACREWHCLKTSKGCGLLWLFDCDGICRGIGH